MSTTPSTQARPPRDRLALLSLVAALYAPVAVPLAFVLDQLAWAASGPPVCQPGTGPCRPPVESPVTGLLMVLSVGLLVLIIPAVGTAIVCGHVAVSRLHQHAAPTRWRSVAWWGLILGYGTFPVLLALLVWVFVLMNRVTGSD
jgi:hypothetical protein